MRSREWPVKHIRVAKENCRAFSFLLNLDYDLTALKCNIISKPVSYQNNRLYMLTKDQSQDFTPGCK